MSKSQLEERYIRQLQEAGLTEGMVREHRFCPPRLFRWDFAWPDSAVAVEIHGGVFVAGRHARGRGIEADAEKIAHAALLGWTVLIVPASWLRRPHDTEGESEAVTWTRALLERRSPAPGMASAPGGVAQMER